MEHLCFERCFEKNWGMWLECLEFPYPIARSDTSVEKNYPVVKHGTGKARQGHFIPGNSNVPSHALPTMSVKFTPVILPKPEMATPQNSHLSIFLAPTTVFGSSEIVSLCYIRELSPTASKTKRRTTQTIFIQIVMLYKF